MASDCEPGIPAQVGVGESDERDSAVI